MRKLLLLPLLLFTLAACTGTQSPQAPRLLFVTHEQGGSFIAALIQEDQRAATAADRLTYLAATEVVLPGEPLAMDVLDRAGSRSQVVLLLEEAANEYSALWLDVSGVEPGSASALAMDLLDLSPLLLPLLPDPVELCLTDLQVSRTGDVLGLFNDPQACGGATLAEPSIFVVDVGQGTARSLAASDSLVRAGVFIRQGTAQADADTLHFLDGAVQSVRLNSVELPAGTAEAGAAFATGSDSPEPLQLTFTDGAFTSLQPSRLQLLEGTAPTTLNLPSGWQADMIVADPSGDQLQALLVLRTGPGARLLVSDTAGSGGPEDLNLSSGVSHGAVDPYQLWVYLLRPGGVDIVDLLGVLEESATGSPVGRYSLPAGTLGSPGFITWVDGVLPPPAP